MPQPDGLALLQRLAITALLLTASPFARPASDQPKPGEPTDPKARKTFINAAEWEKAGDQSAAIADYRKANKQEGGHCSECLSRAYKLALDISDFKTAENIARDRLSMAQTDLDRASGHYRLAIALQRQGETEKKDRCFSDSCDEFKSSLALDSTFAAAHYGLGVSLAHLHQDDAARAEY
jgi:tetratricopeptide (TPR) repeat protein